MRNLKPQNLKEQTGQTGRCHHSLCCAQGSWFCTVTFQEVLPKNLLCCRYELVCLSVLTPGLSYFKCSSPRDCGYTEPWFEGREIVFKMEAPAELKIKRKGRNPKQLPQVCFQGSVCRKLLLAGAINIYFVWFLEREVVCHLLEPHQSYKHRLKNPPDLSTR